jgi:hypothetical protein
MIELVFQLVGLARTPLKVTAVEPEKLYPPVAKLPLMETLVPTGAEAGEMLVIELVPDPAPAHSAVIWFEVIPPTVMVIASEPVVQLLGAETLVLLQLNGVTFCPATLIVLAPWLAPKFWPAIVHGAPWIPGEGETLVITGVPRQNLIRAENGSIRCPNDRVDQIAVGLRCQTV